MTETFKSILKENQLKHSLDDLVDEWGVLKVVSVLTNVCLDNFEITQHEGFSKIAWELDKIVKDHNSGIK